ncbi:MAG: lipopolysaccharide kinase InaA family protein [Desulfuromonas thiophila]|jgi:tRNA A-37 threonylcarbamoyl transferase component Bud32|nr:lipopolysaccharide kinase InaA family protein [Desulfuromonas thiophila]
MKWLPPAEYQRLVQNSRQLEADAFGPKVLLTGEGLVVKIFRRKHLLSRELLSPAAWRFARHARRLQRRGIASLQVERLARCRRPACSLAWYVWLDGEPLRQHCRRPDTDQTALLQRLGTFVALLHQRGVLFRSLHWGNILVQPAGGFALIDVLDLRLQRRPLSLRQRRRNFLHLLRYAQDAQLFQSQAEAFWRGYAMITELSAVALQALRQTPIISRK